MVRAGGRGRGRHAAALRSLARAHTRVHARSLAPTLSLSPFDTISGRRDTTLSLAALHTLSQYCHFWAGALSGGVFPHAMVSRHRSGEVSAPAARFTSSSTCTAAAAGVAPGAPAAPAESGWWGLVCPARGTRRCTGHSILTQPRNA